jgi:hypothetical protein
VNFVLVCFFIFVSNFPCRVGCSLDWTYSANSIQVVSLILLIYFLVYFLYFGACKISEGDTRAAKRARMLVDDSDEDSGLEDDVTIDKNEPTFEDLFGDATFPEEEIGIADTKVGSWGLLDGPVLARIFHFLRSDFKSLVFASMTCKHWSAAVRFYKEVSIQVNLSSLGHSCTDTVLWNIMVGLIYIF